MCGLSGIWADFFFLALAGSSVGDRVLSGATEQAESQLYRLVVSLHCQADLGSGSSQEGYGASTALPDLNPKPEQFNHLFTVSMLALGRQNIGLLGRMACLSFGSLATCSHGLGVPPVPRQ